MKKLAYITLTILIAMTLLTSCNDRNKSKSNTRAVDTAKVENLEQEKEAVIQVMKSYKDALQNRTTEGTFELFAENSEVFEQGKVEGTYNDYIENHLGPELGHFKSFSFNNYKINARVNLPYAYTTETYDYTIVLKKDPVGHTEERTIESKGVATSILIKEKGEWKIVHTHSSFKKLK